MNNTKRILILGIVIIIAIPIVYLYANDYLAIKYHKDPTPMVQEADVKLNNQQYQKALSLYKQALRLNKPYPPQFHEDNVYANVGSCYLAMEKYNEAILAYSKAISISTNNKSLSYMYNMRGMSYMQQDNLEMAKKDLKMVIKLEKDNTETLIDAYHRLATIEYAQKNYEESVLLYDTIAKKFPEYSNGISINYIYALSGAKKHKEADIYCKNNEKNIINYDKSRQAEFYYAWGTVLANLNTKETIKKYEKAITLNPEHHYAYSELCYSYAELNDNQNAIKNCKKAINIYPHPLAYQNTCYAYYKNKQYDKAVEYCNYLIENDYITPNTYYYMALIEKDKNNISSAKENLKKAKESLMQWEEEVSVKEVTYSLKKGDGALLEKITKLEKELDK